MLCPCHGTLVSPGGSAWPGLSSKPLSLLFSLLAYSVRGCVSCLSQLILTSFPGQENLPLVSPSQLVSKGLQRWGYPYGRQLDVAPLCLPPASCCPFLQSLLCGGGVSSSQAREIPKANLSSALGLQAGKHAGLVSGAIPAPPRHTPGTLFHWQGGISW